MHGLATPLYWLIRRWTGYRLYHVVALAVVLLVTLGGLAIPFWWLGEQAESLAGLTGFVIVSLLYLYAAALVLAFSAIVVARSVARRLRRFFPASGPVSHPFDRRPVVRPAIERRSSNAPPLSR